MQLTIRAIEKEIDVVNRDFFCVLLSVVLALWNSSLVHSAEVHLTPDINWIPEKGNFTKLKVTFSEDVKADGSVTFNLRSTNWPGYCMNAGTRSDISPDLSFVKTKQADLSEMHVIWIEGDANGRSITARWQGKAPRVFTLRIDCYDYGAIGQVRAVLSAHGGEASTVMIPYDENKNYIADSWEKNVHSNGWKDWDGNAEDDLERGPGKNIHHGDGLTAFEEYRGFEIEGKYTRTSPKKKDIFIFSEMDEGYGWATKLPSIFRVHLIKLTEAERTNKLTINTRVCMPFFRLSQGAIWIRKAGSKSDELVPRTLGITYGDIPFQGPVRIKNVTIYLETIRYRTLPTKDRTTVDATDAHQINKTIAHEIGHCLNLPHVGMRVENHETTVTFKWEEDPSRTEIKKFKTTPPTSIMQQGLVSEKPGATFPSYHDEHYYLVPDPIKFNEKTPNPAYKSILPDFTSKFYNYDETYK